MWGGRVGATSRLPLLRGAPACGLPSGCLERVGDERLVGVREDGDRVDKAAGLERGDECGEVGRRIGGTLAVREVDGVQRRRTRSGTSALGACHCAWRVTAEARPSSGYFVDATAHRLLGRCRLGLAARNRRHFTGGA